MSWASIGAAAVGLVGSVISSNSAGDAADDAADAVARGTASSIRLAREQRARNEALFAQYLGDENLAQAYLDALMYGQGTYNPSATAGLGGTSDLYPAGTDGQLRARYPDLWTEYRSQGTGLAGDFYGWLQERLGFDPMADGSINQQSPTTITREQVLEMLQGTPLAQYAEIAYQDRSELTDEALQGAYDVADDEYADITSAADLNYAELADLAERARTGRLSVAQQNLVQRLALEDESFAAFLPLLDQQRDKAIDLTFSRGGVSGLTGQTRAGVSEVLGDYAMDRNLRYLEGRQRAYDPYYSDVTGAENTYWGDLGEAETARGEARLDASALRGGRRTSAYNTYSGRRAADYDALAGDRLAAYGNYTDFLQGRVNRGYGARANIASGGQAFVDAATNANTQNQNAQRDAAYQRGAIQQQLYSDIARIAGDAWGSIRNRNQGQKATPLDGGG